MFTIRYASEIFAPGRKKKTSEHFGAQRNDGVLAAGHICVLKYDYEILISYVTFSILRFCDSQIIMMIDMCHKRRHLTEELMSCIARK